MSKPIQLKHPTKKQIKWALRKGICPMCGSGIGWEWDGEEIKVDCDQCGEQHYPTNATDHIGISFGDNPFTDEREI